jgi:hypothetical protein
LRLTCLITQYLDVVNYIAATCPYGLSQHILECHGFFWKQIISQAISHAIVVCAPDLNSIPFWRIPSLLS